MEVITFLSNPKLSLALILPNAGLVLYGIFADVSPAIHTGVFGIICFTMTYAACSYARWECSQMAKKN